MSEIHLPTHETARYPLVHAFTQLFTEAYFLHMDGGVYVKPYEQAELIAVSDANSPDGSKFILGRPKLEAPTNRDVMFWIYTYKEGSPPQNYVTGELSMNVRQSDPSQLYVLSEGEFMPWGEKNTNDVISMLLRSNPEIIE